MGHFAGLDVSVKETSICIVDDTGKIVREVRVASEPEALLAALKNLAYHFKRIGLEAGPLSQWLYSALAEAGLPVICVETRHMRAVLKAQINQTDHNDARGIAQMMRVGLYRPVLAPAYLSPHPIRDADDRQRRQANSGNRTWVRRQRRRKKLAQSEPPCKTRRSRDLRNLQ
jgi:transposase